uniref:Ig-like domain-containing protein n=1 Tax=Macrostomum lignano TaxID=282301 RepID=A0A1I8JN07_9PLAT
MGQHWMLRSHASPVHRRRLPNLIYSLYDRGLQRRAATLNIQKPQRGRDEGVFVCPLSAASTRRCLRESHLARRDFAFKKDADPTRRRWPSWQPIFVPCAVSDTGLAARPAGSGNEGNFHEGVPLSALPLKILMQRYTTMPMFAMTQQLTQATRGFFCIHIGVPSAMYTASGPARLSQLSKRDSENLQPVSWTIASFSAPVSTVRSSVQQRLTRAAPFDGEPRLKSPPAAPCRFPCRAKASTAHDVLSAFCSTRLRALAVQELTPTLDRSVLYTEDQDPGQAVTPLPSASIGLSALGRKLFELRRGQCRSQRVATPSRLGPRWQWSRRPGNCGHKPVTRLQKFVTRMKALGPDGSSIASPETCGSHPAGDARSLNCPGPSSSWPSISFPHLASRRKVRPASSARWPPGEKPPVSVRNLASFSHSRWNCRIEMRSSGIARRDSAVLNWDPPMRSCYEPPPRLTNYHCALSPAGGPNVPAKRSFAARQRAKDRVRVTWTEPPQRASTVGLLRYQQLQYMQAADLVAQDPSSFITKVSASEFSAHHCDPSSFITKTNPRGFEVEISGQQRHHVILGLSPFTTTQSQCRSQTRKVARRCPAQRPSVGPILRRRFRQQIFAQPLRVASLQALRESLAGSSLTLDCSIVGDGSHEAQWQGRRSTRLKSKFCRTDHCSSNLRRAAGSYSCVTADSSDHISHSVEVFIACGSVVEFRAEFVNAFGLRSAFAGPLRMRAPGAAPSPAVSAVTGSGLSGRPLSGDVVLNLTAAFLPGLGCPAERFFVLRHRSRSSDASIVAAVVDGDNGSGSSLRLTAGRLLSLAHNLRLPLTRQSRLRLRVVAGNAAGNSTTPALLDVALRRHRHPWPLGQVAEMAQRRGCGSRFRRRDRHCIRPTIVLRLRQSVAKAGVTASTTAASAALNGASGVAAARNEAIRTPIPLARSILTASCAFYACRIRPDRRRLKICSRAQQQQHSSLIDCRPFLQRQPQHQQNQLIGCRDELLSSAYRRHQDNGGGSSSNGHYGGSSMGDSGFAMPFTCRPSAGSTSASYYGGRAAIEVTLIFES